jgi:hypothetical protein
MTDLLFLGAGASKPYGIPTMKEMVSTFEEYLKKNNPLGFNFYSQIKNSLEKGYGYHKIDIESVFSVIKGIADEVTPEKMGNFVYYYITKNNIISKFTDNEIVQAKKLRTELENFIKEVCNSKLENAKKLAIYDQSYHVIFSELGSKKQGFQKNNYSVDWRAYTTNYDLIFEQFWLDFMRVGDYFEVEGQSAHYFFNSNKNVQNTSLVKLHGSLDWVKTKTGKIMKIDPTIFTRHEIEGEVMLFPIQQKDLYLHPWITLFQNLKNGLHDCHNWIVVGYSFNDEFIFEVFKEAFYENDGKILTIIDPDAKEIRSKFPSELQNRINPLPIKFGDKNFGIQFTDYMQHVKTIEIRIKTESKLVGILVESKFKTAELEPEGNIIVKTQITDSDRKWVEFGIDNPKNEEMKLKIQFEYFSPFEDLKFELLSNTMEKISYSAYVGDRIITSSTTEMKLDSTKQRYHSVPIHLHVNSLFV